MTAPARTWWASLTVLPLSLWWAAFQPGFLSSDSVDQLGQATAFSFTNHHPAFHSLLLSALSVRGRFVAMITLFQVLLMATLLVVIARRLTRLGVPAWLAVGVTWLASLSPAVGVTTIAIWKDVPFTLAFLWAFGELLLLAREGGSFWASRAPWRLGGALALLGLFRQNGFLTIAGTLVVLAVLARRRGVAKSALVALGAPLLIILVGYRLLPVAEGTIEPSEVLIADIAAVFVTEAGVFSPSEVATITRVAPPQVWEAEYDCYDSTPLAFHPDFDVRWIRQHPAEFRGVALTALTSAPGEVLSHRACASSYLYVPAQPADAYFHKPPFDVPPNTLGIERTSLDERLSAGLKEVFAWAEEPHRLWFTWRPALVVWASLLTLTFLAVRRRWLLLWPGSIWAIHLFNVAITSPSQEFRYAFPLFVTGLFIPTLLTVKTADHAP